MLGVIDLFADDIPVWTVDNIASTRGLTRATSYRYVGELCDAGLLTRVARGAYALGPKIIELDRQIRLRDPLLDVGERVMQQLLRPNRGQVVLLCGLYRDKVLCIHQAGRDKDLALSYARGRPMPLFRGATSKVILAWQPERRLTRIFLDHRAEIRKAGLGRTRAQFLASMKFVRCRGVAVSRAEVDPGVVGVAVPIFSGERSVIGSLSIVFPEKRYPRRREAEVVDALTRAAETIRADLAKLAESPKSRGSRAKNKKSVAANGAGKTRRPAGTTILAAG